MKSHNIHITKGFALTEILLSIAVTIIIGISSYSLYTQSKHNSEVESTINDVNMLQIAVKKMYPNNVDGVLSMDVLEQSGLLPENIHKNSDGIYLNAFGGEYTIESNWQFVGRYYLINVTKVPAYACVRILPELIQSSLGLRVNADGGFQEYLTNGNSNYWDNIPQLISRSGICQLAETSSYPRITFLYR